MIHRPQPPPLKMKPSFVLNIQRASMCGVVQYITCVMFKKRNVLLEAFKSSAAGKQCHELVPQNTVGWGGALDGKRDLTQSCHM